MDFIEKIDTRHRRFALGIPAQTPGADHPFPDIGLGLTRDNYLRLLFAGGVAIQATQMLQLLAYLRFQAELGRFV